MTNNRRRLWYYCIRLLLLSFLVVLNILGIASADCTNVPEELNVIDQTANPSESSVVFDDETFSLNFPLYCTPVDIYFAIASPTGKLIFVDSFGGLTLDFIPYTIGTTSAINTSFPIIDTSLASEISGECALYWFIAPTSGGDIIQSINTGIYELGISGLIREQQVKSPDIVLAIPTDIDNITIAWLPIDDVEKYEVHISTSDEFTPYSSTLYKTVTDEIQMDITDLEKETTYYLIVLAYAHSGEIIPGNNHVSATTFSSPYVPNSNNTVNTSDELNLGEHSESYDQLIYSNSQDATLPEIDSIIVSQNKEGEGVLRRVDGVTTAPSEIVLQTSPASLSDVFEQGTVSSKLTLFDVDAVSRSKTAQSKLRAKQTLNDNNERVSTLRWDCNLLAAEQIDYIHDDDEISIKPAEESGRYDIKLRSPKSVTNSLSLSASVNFVPEIITELAWSGVFGTNLERAKLIARGTLSFDANAAYNFSAAASYEPEDRELFSRTFPVRYIIGGVPVWQTITLTVKAQISAHASMEISASADAHVSKQIEIGVNYNSLTGEWLPITGNRESQTLDTDISINGSVDATVKLIPEIEVEFYSSVAGSITIEPFLKAELEAEDITTESAILSALAALTPPRVLHPTKFDVKMGLDSFISASMDVIFDEFEVLADFQVLHTAEKKLFSLPKLSVSRGESRITEEDELEVELILNAANGVNNTFDPASVEWMVIPENSTGNPVITEMQCSQTETGAECRARLLLDEMDTYHVVVSGNGIIGEVARQYANTKVVRGACPLHYMDNGEYCEQWEQWASDTSYKLSYTRSGYLMNSYFPVPLPIFGALWDGSLEPFMDNLYYEEISAYYSGVDKRAEPITRTQYYYDPDVNRYITVTVQWGLIGVPTPWLSGRKAFQWKISDSEYYIFISQISYRDGLLSSPSSYEETLVNTITLPIASLMDAPEIGANYKSEFGYFESVEHWIEIRGLNGQYIKTTPPSVSACSWWDHTEPETGEWVSGCR